jgi:hypothetical protein
VEYKEQRTNIDGAIAQLQTHTADIRSNIRRLDTKIDSNFK